VDERCELFTNAGYLNVQVIEERPNGWICALGRKPKMLSSANAFELSDIRGERNRELP